MRFVASVFMSLCATAAAGLSAAADTPPDAPPIVVQSCSVSGQNVLENPKIGIRMPQITGVTIVYINERQTPATEVRFRIRYQGETSLVVDRNPAAPGAKVSRDFNSVNGIYSAPTAICSATAATFADGTHWTAPGASDAPPPKP